MKLSYLFLFLLLDVAITYAKHPLELQVYTQKNISISK